VLNLEIKKTVQTIKILNSIKILKTVQIMFLLFKILNTVKIFTQSKSPYWTKSILKLISKEAIIKKILTLSIAFYKKLTIFIKINTKSIKMLSNAKSKRLYFKNKNKVIPILPHQYVTIFNQIIFILLSKTHSVEFKVSKK
jgi:hypothetical protein